MKITFFTIRCTHGLAILEQFQKKKIKLDSIIIQGAEKVDILREKYQEKNNFQVIKHLNKGRNHDWLKPDYYYRYAKKVYFVKNFNDPECEQILKKIKPELIVLGGATILKENIINIPPKGIINAHPGLLPGYRGNHVIPWAIYNNDPVGVTVHYINKGVDTGDIIARGELPIAPLDNLTTLAEKSELLAAEMITEITIKIAEGLLLPTSKQTQNEGKLFRLMALDQLQKVEKKLQDLTSAMVIYFKTENKSQLTLYVLEFIFKILGFKAIETNDLDKINFYYGNRLKSLKKGIIVRRKTGEKYCQTIDLDKKSLIIEHDIIESITQLITDQINQNLLQNAFDEHGRLKANWSFQAKKEIIKVPLVNVYLDLIRRKMNKLGFQGMPLWPNNKKYAIGLSHDVDSPLAFPFVRKHRINLFKGLKANYRFLDEQKKFFLDLHPNAEFDDRNWLFPEITAAEKKYGFSSTYFFAVINKYDRYSSEIDVNYFFEDDKFKQIYKFILENNFKIGLHASYNAYQASQRLMNEKKKLERTIKQKVLGLRHHFWHLGINEQQTLEFHEKAGFEYDTSISFEETAGFRRSIALPFYPWLEQKKRASKVLQLPSVCMDSQVLAYPGNSRESFQKIKAIIKAIKEFQGLGVFDWHERTAHTKNPDFKTWGETYLNLLDYLSKDENVWVANLEEINQWVRKRDELLN